MSLMIVMLLALLCIIVGAWLLCNAWLAFVIARGVEKHQDYPPSTRLYDATFDKVINLDDFRRH